MEVSIGLDDETLVAQTDEELSWEQKPGINTNSGKRKNTYTIKIHMKVTSTLDEKDEKSTCLRFVKLLERMGAVVVQGKSSKEEWTVLTTTISKDFLE